MDNFVWQYVTLQGVRLREWQYGSYLHRLVGLLYAWRQSSWLMQRSDFIGLGLVSLVFGLAPFVSSSLIGVLLGAIALFWLLLTLSDSPQWAGPHEASEFKPFFTPIHLLVLLYWAIATVATALSPVKAAAFTGWIKLTLYLLLFALVSRILRSPRLRNWLIVLYLHVALIVSVYGIRQRIFGAAQLATWSDPTSAAGRTIRVYSYLGNPNLLAGYLLPAILLSLAAIFVWRGWFPKLLAATMLVCNTLCMIFTDSRGGWIGVAVALIGFSSLLIYWWQPQMSPFWRTWSFPIALGAVVGLILMAVLFVEPVRNRVSTMFMGRRDSSNNFRMNVWAAVIDMIRDRPILGIGPGNTAFNRIYPLFQRPRYTALSAYSIFLEVLVETGIVGFTAFLWLLLVTFTQGGIQLQRLRNQTNRDGYWLIAALAILLGMLGHGAVDTVWYRPEVNTLWWLTVGLVASYYVAQERTRSWNLAPVE
ncbi:MAG: putative bicarbonate transporter, IctB family [Desertifilum sp. SIO1I2]|nr:putative bicarbonate transporter, IctB family [Desertifilum sp. SIO1I2]